MALTFLNINYKVSNCHVMSPIRRQKRPPRQRNARTEGFQEKCIDTPTHAHRHTRPGCKSFKCAESENGGKGGSNGARVYIDIKRSATIGFMWGGEDGEGEGGSNLHFSNIRHNSRSAVMVIKQRVAVPPRSPTGNLHNTLVNVTRAGT